MVLLYLHLHLRSGSWKTWPLMSLYDDNYIFHRGLEATKLIPVLIRRENISTRNSDPVNVEPSPTHWGRTSRDHQWPQVPAIIVSHPTLGIMKLRRIKNKIDINMSDKKLDEYVEEFLEQHGKNVQRDLYQPLSEFYEHELPRMLTSLYNSISE